MVCTGPGSGWSAFSLWCLRLCVCALLENVPMIDGLAGDEHPDELALPNSVPGPRDRWQWRAAVAGNSPHVGPCAEAGASESFLHFWFRGIISDGTGTPSRVVLGDCPSVKKQPAAAAAELDRLPALGRIVRYPRGDRPPNLSACAPHFILEPDKVCTVHDRSNMAYRLNQLLVNPDVDDGDMHGFLRLLSPGARTAGLDFQGCFLHRVVSTVSRRLLGVRHPVLGPLGTPPGWDDKCIKAVLRIASRGRPSLLGIDFAGDLRLVEKGGGREQLFVCPAQVLSLLTRLGARYHAKEGEQRRPRRYTPWIGFILNADSTEVKIDQSKQTEGTTLREAIMGLETSARVSARALPAAVSRLNFLQWVAPGGFRRFRSWWNAVDEPGIMGRLRAGERNADRSAEVSERLRDDMCWRRCYFSLSPARPIQHLADGRLARYPRSVDLKGRVQTVFPESVCAVYTDASGEDGRGATLGDMFVQGS